MVLYTCPKGTRKEGKKMTRKFKDHPYAQACVIECDDGYKALQSYDTIVIEIDPEGWLKVNCLYSMTTIRHIGWFMRELGFTYQLAKQLYNDRKEFNIYTGEVINND
jgi:hypothetical protein